MYVPVDSRNIGIFYTAHFFKKCEINSSTLIAETQMIYFYNAHFQKEEEFFIFLINLQQNIPVNRMKEAANWWSHGIPNKGCCYVEGKPGLSRLNSTGFPEMYWGTCGLEKVLSERFQERKGRLKWKQGKQGGAVGDSLCKCGNSRQIPGIFSAN